MQQQQLTQARPKRAMKPPSRFNPADYYSDDDDNAAESEDLDETAAMDEETESEEEMTEEDRAFIAPDDVDAQVAAQIIAYARAICTKPSQRPLVMPVLPAAALNQVQDPSDEEDDASFTSETEDEYEYDDYDNDTKSNDNDEEDANDTKSDDTDV